MDEQVVLDNSAWGARSKIQLTNTRIIYLKKEGILNSRWIVDYQLPLDEIEEAFTESDASFFQTSTAKIRMKNGEIRALNLKLEDDDSSEMSGWVNAINQRVKISQNGNQSEPLEDRIKIIEQKLREKSTDQKLEIMSDFKKSTKEEDKINSECHPDVIKEIKYQQPIIEHREYNKPFLMPLLVAILICGIVLLVAGVFLSYYPNSVISGITEKLQGGGLSQADIWMYNGSLAWWNNQLLIVYQPISYFLIVTGVNVIISSVIIATFYVPLWRNKKKSKD